MGKTIIEKIWEQHLVADLADGTSLIYVDRVLLHERTGSIALKSLAEAGRPVRNPGQALVCMDHIVDTFIDRSDETAMPGGKAFIQETRSAAAQANIQVLDIDDPSQGIVHVVSPELGLAQPGLTIVCPDSHTCTQGGVGALAWGIGSTDGEHALATQTLAIRRPKMMRVTYDGELGAGVTAKDMILHLIGEHTASGGAGHAVEFAGSAVEGLSIEGRLTLCNMAVEFAAWTGLCAPDEKTLAYLRGRPLAPEGALWDQAAADWLSLRSDPDAIYDKEIRIDAAQIAPMITWGSSPEQAVAITGAVPDPAAIADPKLRASAEAALAYMDLEPGAPLAGLPIQSAFIGSCTNGRLSDLRAAAAVLRGRRVATGVRAIVVPGSMRVRAAAEAEGLDKVFLDAGFEWRKSGCSMCFFAGGEHFAERERVVTSTNRNFENRQGPGVRSHLASPATVAASAVAAASPTSARWAFDMEKFTRLDGVAAPLMRANVDTDAIIPSREMKRVSKIGLSDGLFANWRYADVATREEDPRFVLNQPPYRGAAILVTGGNFGCGSSREHAVWALHEYGVRCIIAPSFGAIFQGNCVRNGILPIVLDEDEVQALAALVTAVPGARLTIDLEAQTITPFGAAAIPFAIADGEREMLLGGLDAIGVTLKRQTQIASFETDYRQARAWRGLDLSGLDAAKLKGTMPL